MLHKILLSIFASLIISTSSLYSYDYYEHYKDLIALENIYHLKRIVQSNSEEIPDNDYNYAMYLIENIQKYIQRKSEEYISETD